MLPEMHIATFMNLRLAPEALDLLTARQYRELESAGLAAPSPLHEHFAR